MKFARIFAMLLMMTLAALCLSASAMAGFYLPSGLKEIGEEAFMGVTLPKNFAIRSGVEKIGSHAFANSGVEMVWLPETLKEIAPDAFDETATFVCSPNTYAAEWCELYKKDYDYIKPYLNTNTNELLCGETATLTANYIFPNEPTEYFWETRGRGRYWTAVPDAKGSVLRYTSTEDEGYVNFRVSAVSEGGALSVPSDCVTISCYGNTPTFLTDKCKAMSGDSIYLEWKYMGDNIKYILMQWFPDAQNAEGGEWALIDSFTGGWNRTVYGLENNTEYKFQLGILKGTSADIVSETIRITTGNQPTALNVTKFERNGNSVHMAWEPIKNAVYDVYFGYDQNNLSLFSSGLQSTEYYLYNTSKTKKSYVQVKARIPNSDFAFWGLPIEIEPSSEEPVVNIESYEMKGDILTLRWTLLPGCSYDVCVSINGGEEVCILKDSGKTEMDFGGFAPNEKWVVRVVAHCGNWRTSSFPLEVGVEGLNEVEYRALLIGEVSFKGSMYSRRCYGDVESLAEMLKNVKTPSGTYYSAIRRQDLSRAEVFAAIQEAFGSADDNDVSLLYFGTHGDVGRVGRYAGSLCTVEIPHETYDVILMEELAAALTKIKGTKIVWLGSCGSGAGVYDRDAEENVAPHFDGDYKEEEWPDWYEYEVNNDVGGKLIAEDMPLLETGELRLPDFQVMTAARYRFFGWGKEAANYTFFVHFLTEGVCGPDGSMPADLNEDGELTQHELFTYIKEQMEDPETGSDQDIQAYPFESNYVLFAKQ